MKYAIRKAKISDATKIKKTVDTYAKKEVMLFRPIYAVYADIRDFFVAEKSGKIIGCCALNILGKEYKPGRHGSVLAEVKSLAVLDKYQGKGVGTKLVQSCIKEARKMEIEKLFALTIEPNLEFFKKMGFKETKKSKLPQKIWQECANCPRFPKECNEIALTLIL